MRLLIVIVAALGIGGCDAVKDDPTDQDTAASARTHHADGRSDLQARLASEGVDFYARGNEPSWALDMDLEGAIRFTALEGPSLSVSAPEGVRAQDADIVRYRTETEAGTLDITISGEPCVDAMSGEEFTHRVRVTATPSGTGLASEYEGCGRYLPDERLAGAWTLVTIDEQPINPDGLPKGPPRLEFSVSDLRLAGHGGCNMIRGTFTTEGQTIRIGPVATTMMACPGLDLEQKFLSALGATSFRYEIRDSLLLLTGGSVLRFTRAG